MESPLSPLRFHSPLRSDLGDPPESPPYSSPADDCMAIFAVDKFSPVPESGKAARPPVVMGNRAMREDPVAKRGGAAGEGGREKAALGLRVCEVVLCLISLSVMAADRTEGWTGDSFERYKEYRYCLSMNVIAFVYAGLQTFHLSYHLITRKYLIRRHFRLPFTFFIDQVLAYLLVSASSSAATRVDDWQSNWGKDEFTVMATASVAISFLAFLAFALSSLVSGYDLCTQDSTWHDSI